MKPVCYLCSEEIVDLSSGDHAVPSVLIERTQPKVKGYDYGGILPTHPTCNNRFGPEKYTAKALDLLVVLGDKNCFLELSHPADPHVNVMAINSGCLPTFTEDDLRFFKFIDCRDTEMPQWSAPDFFAGQSRANPKRAALLVALSVLAKSSAALLVKRHSIAVPTTWRIFSFPYLDAQEPVNFDSFVGNTKSFEIGVKPSIRRMDTGDWFVIYQARGVLVFTVFAFSGGDVISQLGSNFSDTDGFYFEGATLNELLTKGWKKV